MKFFIGIIFVLVSQLGFSQNFAPGFEIEASNLEVISTLGGYYVSSENRIEATIKKDLVLVTEMDEGDFVLFEINKDDKKDYQLELVNEKGEIIISISNFNSASYKVVKNTFGSGNYVVQLTQKGTNIIDYGRISFN